MRSTSVSAEEWWTDYDFICLGLRILWEHHVDTILVCISLSTSSLSTRSSSFQWYSFSRFFLQLLFLRRPIYPSHSSDLSPLIFIQHPMVSHDQRGSKVKFLQGDPEDREKVLVPDVNVYCCNRWDDYSFDFAGAVYVAGWWVSLGCDFSFVVSGLFGILKIYSRVFYVFFPLSFRLSVSCHILFPVRALSADACIFLIFFPILDCRLCWTRGLWFSRTDGSPDIDIDRAFFKTSFSFTCYVRSQWRFTLLSSRPSIHSYTYTFIHSVPPSFIPFHWQL